MLLFVFVSNHVLFAFSEQLVLTKKNETKWEKVNIYFSLDGLCNRTCFGIDFRHVHV